MALQFGDVPLVESIVFEELAAVLFDALELFLELGQFDVLVAGFFVELFGLLAGAVEFVA